MASASFIAASVLMTVLIGSFKHATGARPFFINSTGHKVADLALKLLAPDAVANFCAFECDLVLLRMNDGFARSDTSRDELLVREADSKVRATSAASLAGMKLGFSAHRAIALHAST